MDATARIARLVEWAASHGASLHPSVEIYDDATTGLSFRVRPSSHAPLQPWERVVSLPTSLSLSYLDAVSPTPSARGSGPAFHHDLLSRTPAHVIGRLFLAKEYLRGSDSFWWPYIQALPQPDDTDSWALPPFWAPEDAELLEGTNVEVGLDKMRADVRREYSDAAALLQLCGDDIDRAITPRLYHWAYCVFSSRSFRPSLVLPDLDADGEGRALPPGISMDDFSVLLPLFDIGNHDMTADVRWDLRRDQSRGGDVSFCELRMGGAFAPGQQVFNNYSMKTNAELLLGYGFMLPVTDDLHNDYTHVRKRTATPTKASEEYYISRRPMAHPSSLLGRSRGELAVDLPPGTSMVGAFQHVQPDMVWDIFCTLTQPEQRAQLLPVDVGRAVNGEQAGGDEGPDEKEERQRQRRFFSGDVEQGSEAHALLEHTVAIIQHKVMQELERLEETDVEVAAGDEQALTRNQRLALDYRQRCRAVLENTLEAMGAGIVEEQTMLDGGEGGGNY